MKQVSFFGSVATGALLLAASLPLPARAQIMIATPLVDSFGTIYSPASSRLSSTALGQTFVTPDATHTQLDRFELRAASYWADPPADFNVYLAQWDAGTHQPVGAPLWTSSLQSAAGLAKDDAGGSTLSFTTSGVGLAAGQTYLLVATAAAQPLTDAWKASGIGYTFNSTYAGGDLVMFGLTGGTALSYATLSTATRSTFSSYDLAFGATFSEPGLSAVPEPAAPAAVLTLALCAGLFVLRRRQLRVATASATLAARIGASLSLS
jgi:hypothetical protein